MTFARRDRLWLAVAALTLLGFVLRLLAARGALWLDEAWSALFAQQARDVVGVFWRINHDNNHFLNTLWLQLVGPDAAPIVKRGLSIVCGTATIPLAAALADRRKPGTRLITALLFALSPIFVSYGAEARGYAPMLLATVAALLIVDRWFDRRNRYAWLWLALVALAGMLAQFLMVASLAAIGGWVFFTVRRQRGPAAALRETPLLLGGAAGWVLLVLALVVIAARHSPVGFSVGSYDSFSSSGWADAVADTLGWTFGIGHLPAIFAALGAIVIAALLLVRRAQRRTTFYALAILAYSLAFPILRIGNAGMPRYYLLAALALVLLAGELLGAMIARGGWRRATAGVMLALFAAGSVRLDLAIADNRRADPAAAIVAMRARAPRGAVVTIGNERMAPVLAFAARDAHYRLRIVQGRCENTPFLLLDGNTDSANLAAVARCGRRYRQIARAQTTGLSGTWWWLFERIS